jgi:hypothetical protein
LRPLMIIGNGKLDHKVRQASRFVQMRQRPRARRRWFRNLSVVGAGWRSKMSQERPRKIPVIDRVVALDGLHGSRLPPRPTTRTGAVLRAVTASKPAANRMMNAERALVTSTGFFLWFA